MVALYSEFFCLQQHHLSRELTCYEVSHSSFPFGFNALLIWRKNFQCRSRWMIKRAANIRLVLLCIVTHWFFAIPRYVNQPLPRPPPSGNTRYRTSPETSDGMKVIRQPMSTSALMVMRFMINLRSYLDCAGKNIFRNPAYVISMHSNPVLVNAS